MMKHTADQPRRVNSKATKVNNNANAYVELHAASAFSFLRGASSPETLVARAASLGMPALALTDHMTLAGVVRFQAACAVYNLAPIIGVELAVAEPVFGLPPHPTRPSYLSYLVALAENATGYARLCRLLTDANLARPDAPVIAWRDLAAEPDGLILLTGGRGGSVMRLLLAGRRQAAVDTARRYRDAFGPDRVFIELHHHRLPDTTTLLHQLVAVAQEVGLRCVATNGVRYGARDDCALYDLMTCTRLGLTVDQPHVERPRNDEAHLKSGRELAPLCARSPRSRRSARQRRDRGALPSLPAPRRLHRSSGRSAGRRVSGKPLALPLLVGACDPLRRPARRAATKQPPARAA